MKVLVAGSSSVLGRHIVAELKQRGHSVRALSRNVARAGKVGADEAVSGDALVAASLDGAMHGVDAVISCVGASVLPTPRYGWRGFYAIDWPANRNLIDAAVAAGVRKFVYVSVMSADKNRWLAYCGAHERVVDHLRAKGIDFSVLRPTAFHSALSEFVRFAERGLIPVFGARFKTNPIHDADLAEACVDALLPGISERDLGGPEVLTRREIAELATRAAKRRATIVNLPPMLLRFAALSAFLFPRISQLLAFFAFVMSRDLVAPSTGKRTLAHHFEAHGATSPPRE